MISHGGNPIDFRTRVNYHIMSKCHIRPNVGRNRIDHCYAGFHPFFGDFMLQPFGSTGKLYIVIDAFHFFPVIRCDSLHLPAMSAEDCDKVRNVIVLLGIVIAQLL